MSDQVDIAIIGALSNIVLGVLGVLGYKRLRRRTDEVGFEITNDHEQPLRVDMDDKHTELVRELRETRRDVGGMRQDVRQLRVDLSQLTSRVNDIDDTQRKERK